MQCFGDAAVLKSFDGAEPDLDSYDKIIVAFSGGKDSIACFLHLLDRAVPISKIELWHHEIDGREHDEDDAGALLMDWPCTVPYCRAFAKEFGVSIFFSWREGGFAREMGRKETPTAPVYFEDSDGVVHSRGGKGPRGTRGVFPQVCADLSKRWCSAYLKIDVASAAIRGQPRFHNARTLIITGERAQESAARARYARLEIDRSDARGKRLGRHVDHWRPIQDWTEETVWDALCRHAVYAPPAYILGWSRLSCLFCIFGNANQWASARYVAPELFDRVVRKEAESGLTIHRSKSVVELADSGTPYAALSGQDDLIRDILSRDKPWTRPIREQDKTARLVPPAGAFGASCGPT